MVPTKLSHLAAGPLLLLLGSAVQADIPAPRTPEPVADSRLGAAPGKVEVPAVAPDEGIRDRLQNVLEATGWFRDTAVHVERGVVFLDGSTEREDLKEWAGELARNTDGVAAVVNRLTVTEPFAWDFRGAREGLHELWRDLLRSLPFVALGFVILLLAGLAGRLTAHTTGNFLERRVQARLLRVAAARAAGILVFLAGFYVVLRVAGLTQLALTLVGGTGLLGLAVGIAFRDITENFLASLFLSVQRPFETGDLIEIAGITGYVRQLNTRTTVLVNLEGNLVQIPNATIYKSTLRNFSRNPKRRESFDVGIGYDAAIDEAQEIARKVLKDHPAVLDDPEPWVLADSFASATIQMRIYFWIDGNEHSWLKVRSSVIRLVKRAFQENGISMPDELREVIFPRGVPVTMMEDAARPQDPERKSSEAARPEGEVCTEAEAGLSSQAEELDKQANEAEPVHEKEENLLKRRATG